MAGLDWGLLGVPWDEGNAGRNGANMGPRSVRDASRKFPERDSGKKLASDIVCSTAGCSRMMASRRRTRCSFSRIGASSVPKSTTASTESTRVSSSSIRRQPESSRELAGRNCIGSISDRNFVSPTETSISMATPPTTSGRRARRIRSA
ncbi:MAG: arginase family protein [Maioricimonas sp. JB049]